MIAGIAGLCLLIASLVAVFHQAPLPVIAYDFHYRIVAPAALHGAQVFTGTHHTYLILPPGEALTAAAILRQKHPHPVTARRDGPYWQLPGIAHAWQLTTTRGTLTATAIQAPPAAASPIRASVRVHPVRPRSPAVTPTKVVARPMPAVRQHAKTISVRGSSKRHLHVAALRFKGSHLSARGMARLMVMRAALRRATDIRILAFAHNATARDRHQAARRAVILAAILLRWGVSARHMRIHILTGAVTSVEIAFLSAHKDILS